MFYGQRIVDVPDGLQKWEGKNGKSKLLVDSDGKSGKEGEGKGRGEKERRDEEEDAGVDHYSSDDDEHYHGNHTRR